MSFKKSLLTYGLVDVLSKAIGLITSPISTRLLTMSQYGAGPLLSAVWSPLSLAQYGGMDWAYPFFYARRQSDDDGRRLIASATVVAYVAVLIVWFVFLIFSVTSGWLANYASVTQGELTFFVLGLLPAALIYWLCYLLRFLHRSESYVKITLLGRILPAVVVLPVLPWYEQEYRLLITFGLGWLLSCLALVYALYEVRRVGHWPFIRTLFDAKLSREMLRYGLVLVPSGAAYALIVVTDRLLVGYFLGGEAVAIHVIAIAIGSVGTMFVAWFGLAFDPHLSEWVASGDQTRYLHKLQLLAICIAAFFAILSCLAAIWSTPVVLFVYPDEYAPSAKLVPIIIYAAGFSALSRLAVATALIAQSPKYHTVLYWTALVINVIAGLILIPLIGIAGAAISTAVAEATILAGWIYFGRIRLRNLKIKWGVPAVMLLFSAIFIGMFVVQVDNALHLWLRISTTLASTALVLLLLYSALGKDGVTKLLNYARR